MQQGPASGTCALGGATSRRDVDALKDLDVYNTMWTMITACGAFSTRTKTRDFSRHGSAATQVNVADGQVSNCSPVACMQRMHTRKR